MKTYTILWIIEISLVLGFVTAGIINHTYWYATSAFALPIFLPLAIFSIIYALVGRQNFLPHLLFSIITILLAIGMYLFMIHSIAGFDFSMI
jgi:hypothetical protein